MTAHKIYVFIISLSSAFFLVLILVVPLLESYLNFFTAINSKEGQDTYDILSEAPLDPQQV